MKQVMICILTIAPIYLGAMSEGVNEKVRVESSQDEAEASVKRACSEEEQYEPVPVKRALESASSTHRVKRVALDFSELENLSAEEKNQRLLLAAESGETHLVEALLSCGAGKDALTEAGEHSLHLAASEGHVAVIEKLHELGASVDEQDSGGWTPLHFAARYGQVEVIAKLCELGAAIDTQDSEGGTPLYVAAETGHVGAIVKLCELGATIDIQDRDGNIPLDVAAGEGHVTAVRELLSPLPYGTEQLTLTFVGDERREVSKNVILVSSRLRSVCDSSSDDTIPLMTITAATWDAIMKFEEELYALEFIYNSLLRGTDTIDSSEYAQQQRCLVQAYQTLSYEEIHKIIDAANFLDIKVVVRCAAAALIEKAMQPCSRETKKVVLGEFKKYSKRNYLGL